MTLSNGKMLTEIYGMVKSNCANIKNLNGGVKEIHRKLDNGNGKMNENSKNIAVLSNTVKKHLENHKNMYLVMTILIGGLGVIFTAVNLFIKV